MIKDKRTRINFGRNTNAVCVQIYPSLSMIWSTDDLANKDKEKI